MSTFTITQDRAGEYRFALKADNGQTILVSEGYTTRANCEGGIASVRTNSQSDSRYQRKQSTNGKHYFNLTATNGQVIGTSEMYESAQGMEGGIASVKVNAPVAVVQG